MAHFVPHNVDDIIASADVGDINSLLSSVLSMATQMDISSYTLDENTSECIYKNDDDDDDDDDGDGEDGDGEDGDDEEGNEDDDDIFHSKSFESNKLKTSLHHRHTNCKRNIEVDRKRNKLSQNVTKPAPEVNLTFDAYGEHSDNCNNLQGNFRSSTCFTSVINTSTIEEIESDLQFYEKVSLVFLLYDSDDLALQRLKTAFRSHTSGSITHCRLLSDWAMHENSENWQGKFMEALSIIKNISWVKRLGFSMEEINLRFLPRNPETSLYVDLLRKALYIVCESLSCKQLEYLQILVDRDMENVGRIIDRYDVEFMEMNILHWMSQRYLNIGVVGSCDVNIKNLTKHLKVMEEYRFVDYLECIARRYYKPADVISDPQSFSDQLSVKSGFSQGGISSHSVVSQCQEVQPSISNNYMIDPKNVGVCVIINQKTFYKDPNPILKDLVHEDYLEPRIGTDVDRDRLCEIFMSLGFFVKIWENLTHIELVHAIQESATKLVTREHSCFFLCILSHGRKNAVYGVNSIAVSMDEIEKLLYGKYCPNLLHKPKIIIVQACQGLVKQNAYITDIAEDGATQSTSSPEVSDILTFWSTVPGYAAFRDRITGSWFVRALWDEMLKKGSFGVDILSMFVNVTAQVCNKRAPLDGELKAMTPHFSGCIRKRLFFPFHKEARKAAAKRMFERFLFDCLLNEFIEKIVLNEET